MVGSGHLSYYFKVYRNLYKYSQQGWESLNAKFKTFFIRHTQRGGNYGNVEDENKRSYLWSIMYGFQRELIWISGIGEEHYTIKT